MARLGEEPGLAPYPQTVGEGDGPSIAPRAAPADPVDRNTVYIRRALGSLDTFAPSLCVLLPQAQLNAAAFDDLGFLTVRNSSDMDLTGVQPETVLITIVGVDEPAVHMALQQLTKNTQLPSLVVIMVMPYEEGDPQPTPTECVEHIRSMKATRESLFDAGADEVVCLMGGEALQAHRVVEIMLQAEYSARKTGDMVSAEVAAVERNAMQGLTQAHEKFVMMMPGRALENLPSEDRTLQEFRNEAGILVGVGDFTFKSKLGSGVSAHVFRAEHPRYGTCAVKVLAKKSMTNANTLVALNRELCQLLYAEPHPNIVRAYDVLHARRNFYVIMEYAGSMHLQNYVKSEVIRTGMPALPKDIVLSFSRQQAAGVAHLHKHFVCHRDLRPDNWVVSDDGQTLRLTDFSLAMQLSGPAHQLRHSCGSLPFCAPEVFQSGALDFACFSGHDGLAADMWSLGVNYAELMLGPYSIEEMLGWIPTHPAEDTQITQGLRSLAALWEPIASENPSILSTTISNLLKVQPAERWRIGQVMSAEGLGDGTGDEHGTDYRRGLLLPHLQRLCAR